MAAAFLRVVRAGLLTTVQDLGRPGYAHLGVPRSGAVDVGALRLANRLVGNDEGAAALETTLNGCAVSVMGRGCWVAVAGAAALVTVTVTVTGTVEGGAAGSGGTGAGQGGSADSCGAQAPDRRPVGGPPVRRRVVAAGEPFFAPAGSVVDVGSARVGVRSYVAFAGGLVTAPAVASRSFDLLSGIGGDRGLADGDTLPLGEPRRLPPGLGEAGVAVVRGPEDPAVVRCLPGPRDDWFAAEAVAVLGTAPWVVGVASNRTGLRLEGPALRRGREGELTSEGLVPGAVQVPPDGRPVVFLADHPVTGGYPVIGCVDPRDLGLLGQARPGTGVRFRMVARA